LGYPPRLRAAADDDSDDGNDSTDS